MTMGGRFSLSKAGLAEFCVHPFTRAAPDWPRVIKEIDSRINRAFHWVCTRVINDASFPPSPTLIAEALTEHNLEPDKYRSKLEMMRPIQHASLFRQRFITAEAEVALAYDWKTGDVRRLGKDLGRNYVIGPTEIASTLDAFGASANDPDFGSVVEIIDWKTGPRARQNVTHCAGNRQIGGLAMMLSRIIDPKFEPYSIKQVLSFVSEDGTIFQDEYLADPIEDTNETESWLQDVIARIERGEDPNPGMHCIDQYCPMIGVCPATQKAVQIYEMIAPNPKGELVPKDQGVPLPTIVVAPEMFMSDEHAQWAIHRAQAITKVAEQVIDAAKVYASTKPGHRIALTNGKYWGAGSVKTPHVEVRGVERLQDFMTALIGEIGEENFANMVLTHLSASDLKEAAKSDKAYKQMVSNLRKAGFVRDEEKTEFRERNYAEPKLQEKER